MFWPHVAKTIRLYILTLFWSLITVIVISRIEKESYSSSEFVSLVFHPQKPTSHFWFLFSLVSLYLLLPVVTIVYDYDDVRPLFWLLFLLFLFSFGNELGNWSLNILTHSAGYWSDIADGSIKEHHLFDVEGVNPFRGNFWAWVYFICGGLIGKYLEKEHIRIPLWGLYLTFVISILALFGYGTLASEWMNGRTFDTVANAYTSVPVLAMTLSVFRILCHLPRVDGKAGSFISSNRRKYSRYLSLACPNNSTVKPLLSRAVIF